jgi:TRAP-type mannitol/chloroaromatic compound transport system permease large subunit
MNRPVPRGAALFGRVHGSLYLATIFTATLFAAATGIVGASVTIIALMAGTVMLRSGYDVRMSAGTICAGGTLGNPRSRPA